MPSIVPDCDTDEDTEHVTVVQEPKFNEPEVKDYSETCCDDVPTCSRDVSTKIRRKRPKFIDRRCPRKDILADFEDSEETDGVERILSQVKNGEITTAAELIFCLRPYVRDRGKVFMEILEKNLGFFRKLVDSVVDSRVQDEGDVMHCTQNSIKEKFSRLTESMSERTLRIKERLHKISPKFDWEHNGKDKRQLAKLIVIKKKEVVAEDDSTEHLIHQVFIRGQWLKRELYRLQEENRNLKIFLENSKKLAFERKAQEIEVPRMLAKELRTLEKRLEKLKKIYNKNTEKIHTLYINCTSRVKT